MDFTSVKDKMEKTISVFAEKLSEVRAGRANPAILNKVKIDYYGTPTPINQVAGVSVPEARLIVIQPWDRNLMINQMMKFLTLKLTKNLPRLKNLLVLKSKRKRNAKKSLLL